jgi:peroxiredoxin
MKNIILLSALFISNSTFENIESGKAAPNFSLPNEEDKSIELAKYKGKTAVLEWYNKYWPCVKKHYGSNNMQQLQNKWTEKSNLVNNYFFC